MYYEVYGYHRSPTEPTAEDLNELIFGMELEIDNPTEQTADLLDFAVESDYLTTPHNEHRTQRWKCIENDSSVYKEIILSADKKEFMLKRIKNLNNIGFVPENMNNSSGTSCHIHINRKYLVEKGIAQNNLFRLFELYTPFIYAISGRNENEFYHWAEPKTPLETNNINWRERAERLAGLTPARDRYYMVNCTRNSTIELRAFSNKCGFDYKTIKLYLDFVEFCVHQAESMSHKRYINHYKRLLNELHKFFISNHRWAYDKYKLNRLFRNDIYYKSVRNTVNNRFMQIRDWNYYVEAGEYTQLLRMLYYQREEFKLRQISISPQGIINAVRKIQEQHIQVIRDYLQFYMKTLSHEALMPEFYI